ncbi:2-oxoglutarate and iron-dependent oxygenase domain-containing protein [Rapidithrix thailandica]|uniref:2-oxoglutarate-dependent ethylene/succinate-forming enzyme n=1 Tax=Rapidithrix thailandica TaxID=413964 RepID=A0AAW9RYF0_9BACT
MSELQTFQLPESIKGTYSDRFLAKEMINAWRTDGIFQVEINKFVSQKTQAAFDASRRFFRLPMALKSQCISDLSYAGYIASGEEITAGKADFSEIFTVCRDIPCNDPRVREKWPCHGPVPWPDERYQESMKAYMEEAGAIGEKLLQLVALGLQLDINHFTTLTDGGWHHMRVLRFPEESSKKSTRGIGAHTDYGLLVIAAQDEVGGLFVRPPVEGEPRNRNWLPTESTAGMYEQEEPWVFVKPVPNVLTVFPGDILQFITNGYLLSTPHKVKLHPSKERFALAYFHEPNFEAYAKPVGSLNSEEYIHYGEHFTNMFMRCYPDRVTTQRIEKEGRLAVLQKMKSREVESI